MWWNVIEPSNRHKQHLDAELLNNKQVVKMLPVYEIDCNEEQRKEDSRDFINFRYRIHLSGSPVWLTAAAFLMKFFDWCLWSWLNDNNCSFIRGLVRLVKQMIVIDAEY